MKSILLPVAVLLLFFSCKSNTDSFVCTPCDLPCDTLTFTEPGTCPHCKMELINESKLIAEEKLTLNEIAFEDGDGAFLIDGGDRRRSKRIIVHYYKPKGFSPDSRVIMVIPGAGRNGDDYRDAWIEKAEIYNVLVLSPEYAEKYYPEFWSYNLAGMITDVEINKERTAMTGFKINKNPNDWIYNDFDRIFGLTKEALALRMDTYDMFGHSAGGQLLHRLAIFKPENRANRILAANSGWYTVPTEMGKFPYGLKNGVRSPEDVDFSSNLVVFLGEKDDANETRGDLRHSPEMDKQGMFRLSRGKHFYSQAKKVASKENSVFNWKIEIVPGVGHDYRKMSEAAADYLYGDQTVDSAL